MPSDSSLPTKCLKNTQILNKKLNQAYNNILVVVEKGESGKMDIPQKQKTYEKYKFYADCYKNIDNSSKKTKIIIQTQF